MLAFLQAELIPEIPLADWANDAEEYVTERLDLDGAADALDAFIDLLASALMAPPELLMVAILAAVAFFLSGWRVALLTALGLLFIISLGLWEASMETLTLVVVASGVSLAIGIPLGIVAAKSGRFETAVRPILDVAQTMPAFVYLVPLVVLLSIGNPTALVATVVFAMPPAVRLTMLGIQQVPRDTVEAAHAFGATPWQALFKVELPLSLRSIMAGVNQVIMLSLSMVVVGALAGAGGLGEPVVSGLSQLNVGEAFVGGVGIVIIAIILDRVTRGLEKRRMTTAKKTA
jgi:glycine betaine/proline transport system permease protein